MVESKIINQLAEQDWARLHAKFKQEVIREWDELECPYTLNFPQFILTAVYLKWMEYVRLN